MNDGNSRSMKENAKTKVAELFLQEGRFICLFLESLTVMRS